MKSAARICAILLVFTSATVAFNPPKGLSWGMTLSDVREAFAFSTDEDKPKIEKVFNAGKWDQFFCPKDMIDKNEQLKLARLENVSLLGKKMKGAYLLLDTTDHLIAFQYQNYFIEGDASKEYQKCWEQYQKFADVLREKYGSPTKDDVTSSVLGKEIVKGTHFDTIWKDTASGEQIVLTVTLARWGSGLLGHDQYMVTLRYESRQFNAVGQAKAKSDDF